MAESSPPSAQSGPSAASAYLDLLKRAVNGYLQLGETISPGEYFVDDAPRYVDGRWQVPPNCTPHTVLHRAQLDLLELIARDVVSRGVPGDFMEAGIWRGGAVIFLLGLVRILGLDRQVIAADTFAGIPLSEGLTGDPVDQWSDRWEASREQFDAAVARYGLNDQDLHVIAGPIPESIEASGGLPGSLALLRIDVDSFESTRAALLELYPALSTGGAVIIDDWHLPGCFAAVAEYRAEQGITAPITEAAMNAYWFKSPQ
jgi:O-methyltransferase/8-demethyl-8-(2,3-dimethoxy-alpha-L-rhamnosyl)tetracenomycin-C 4'-O-methyltransferase